MNASYAAGPSETVVVTGGAGFIGRALVARCLHEGHDVVVVDNLVAGSLKNLEAFLDRITFCEGDALDVPLMREVMARVRPSTVFHLAAHHFIPFCNEHPAETLRVNVEGTHVVLSEAARAGVGVAVVASSGALYPGLDDLLDEELEPAPADIYALSKLMAEQVTRFTGMTTGMKCVAARLFNTYGPYETNPHVIPDIIESLRRGPEVRLGNTHPKRDYIYVEDVADLLYRCARKSDSPFEAVNVGTGTEYSVEEIVQEIGRLLGQVITIGTDPSRVRAVDKLHQRADTRRLERMTGMQARHSLAEGLGILLEHECLKLPA